MSTKTRLLSLLRPGAAFIALLVGADVFAPVLTQNGASEAAAQTIVSLRPYPIGSLPAGQANATEDNDSAFLIQYIGAQQSGTAQISSGDLLLKHGVLASEIADTTITGCGGTAGTLDVDTSPCTTLGGLVDKINTSANWRAVQLDGLRSNVTAAATLVTLAATQAKVTGGLGVKWDTSVLFQTIRAAVPSVARGIEFYLDGVNLRANPFGGTQSFLNYLNETTTFGSGTSTIQCYSDTPTLATGGASGAATETLEYTIAGGATTVNKVIADFEFSPLGFKPNARLVCRVNNSAAASVPQLVIGAYQTPSP